MGRNARNQARRTAVTSFLMATAALTPLAMAAPATAQASQQAARAYEIPAQPLSDALVVFASQSGLQVATDGAALRGVRSPGVRGALTPRQALERLLAGTGFTYRLNGSVVTLERAPQAAPGAIQLGAVRVEGAGAPAASGSGNGSAAGWDGTAGSVYVTPGSVSVISRQTLEAYPGSSPADVLKGESGLMSAEARNSGGLDVNIRGLQGQGRIAVTVDGAMNGTSVYRGYQGVSNRNFIDPDFISSIAVQKGPSMTGGMPSGIGGSLSMTTLSPDDIIAEGETTGMRLKLSLSDNSSAPRGSESRSLLEQKWSSGDPLAITHPVNRPNPLNPGGGSGSLIWARKGERVDLLAGYAFRQSGNYHAGAHGRGAPKRTSSPSPYCASGAPGSERLQHLCANAAGFYEGHGMTAFVGGEAVLNTSTDTESWLFKAIIRPAPDHTLELGYGGYRSDFGENYPSEVSQTLSVVKQHWPLSNTALDRFTARHRWNPANDLIDLKSNIWLSQLNETSASLAQSDPSSRDFDSWGLDVTNSSRLSTPLGWLNADYGAAYLHEKAGPSEGWVTGGAIPPAREGVRDEYTIFAQASLEPTAWLRLDGGLRYQSYDLEDRQSGTIYNSQKLNRSEDAFGFSLGATAMPMDGLQLFATYKQAARLPSLMEATSGFFMMANPDLHKEEAHNWEIGANYLRTDLFAADDELGLKLVWFDNSIEDYIARRYVRKVFQTQMYNIDRAEFRGLEANASYRRGATTIDAGITWYDHIAFCRPDEGCIASSLASDYGTNYIPPKWAANLSVNRNFMNDRLNLGGRLVYRDERAVTFEPTESGMSPLIAAIPWSSYVTADVTGRYRFSPALSLDFSIENLTDQMYVEPLSLGIVPAPGRTIRIGLTSQLGAGSGAWPGNWFNGAGEDTTDWTGFYVGGAYGYGFGQEDGDIHDLSGAEADGGRVDQSYKGVSPGVHAGYNWQLPNNLVLGLEGDIARTSMAGWSGVLVTGDDSNAQSMRRAGRLDSSVEYDWDWTAAVRGRVGYAFGRTLVYGTGGAAFLRESQTRMQYRSDTPSNLSNSHASDMVFFFKEKASVNRTGWTLGFGVERDLGQGWSMRTDYAYSNFGSQDFTFEQARAGGGRSTTVSELMWDPVTGMPVLDPVTGRFIFKVTETTGSTEIINGRKARADADLHVLRVGFSYRF